MDTDRFKFVFLIHLLVLRYLLITFLIFSSAVLHAQSPIDWWYFGDSAGVHFTSSGPVAVSDGALITWEGAASVSTPGGDLLFYTNGETVWDSTHNIMPNGTGLLGSISAVQSATIVPFPGNSGKYYLFTTPSIGGAIQCGTGEDCYFAYSIIDMSLNGGLGDVEAGNKNIVLMDSATEKCAVTSHSNGVDYWVVTHERYGTAFQAYHLSSSGIVDTVTSNVGINYAGTTAEVGEMTFSPQGDKLAVSSLGSMLAELFFFDVFTGQLQLEASIATGFVPPYGVEFSPSGQYLYVSSITGNTSLSQYNLSSSNIQASAEAIATTEEIAGITTGPDGKIYLAKDQDTPYLARINAPDLAGASCGFQDSAVALTGNSWFGLPNFIHVNLLLPRAFEYDHQCFAQATMFSYDSAGVDSLRWNFGDPASGAQNTSEAFAPTHVFSDQGWYDVTLIVYRTLGIDTIVQHIQIFPRQEVDLGGDTVLCAGDTLHLSAAQPYAFFEWRGGSAEAEALVINDSLLWITVLGICDTVSDTIEVRFDEPVSVYLDPMYTPCDSADYLLEADVMGENPQIIWNTGGKDTILTVTESGTYEVSVTNACGTVQAKTEVTFISEPKSIPLPADTVICNGQSLSILHPGEPYVSYTWSDLSSQKEYIVDTTATVWLVATNACGTFTDSVHVQIYDKITSELGSDTNICDGDSILLDAVHPGSSYVWNTGETTDTIWTDQVESFNYVVTITYGECETIASRRVDMDDFFCESIDCTLEYPNTFSPNGDGINDLFRAWSNCHIESYTLYVYNRWGELVHFDAHDAFGWDGNTKGQQAPEGVYYFILDFKDQVVVDEDRNTYHGSFTLVR